MTDEKPRRGCLRRGCCGCLALPLVVIAALAILSLTARLTRGPQEMRHDEQSAPTVAPGSGYVGLDMRGCVLRVVPVAPGAPLRVVADYDASMFTLEQVHEPAPSPEGRWTWRVSCRPRNLGLFDFAGGVRAAEVLVEVPRGMDLALNARLREGVADMDLGGLSLSRVDVDAARGQSRIDFSAPPPAPLGALRVKASMGQCRIERLGNASPRETAITGRMGEVAVDLSGPWRGTAAVESHVTMGTLRLSVPDAVPLQVARVHADIGEIGGPPLASRTIEPGAPSVTLSADVTFGEIEVAERAGVTPSEKR